VSEWAAPRRFWTRAEVAAAPGGWTVRLDARVVKTPARNALVTPHRAAAEACAAEWAAQGDRIDPRAMPVTRALNSAIDRVAPQFAEVAASVAAYGESDLLCYRAPGPQALCARQAAAWDPWLAWARTRWAAPLVCAAGVIPVAQPAGAVATLARAVADRDALSLTALHDLVALSGSLVLGLAVDEGALEAAEAWALSRVDETWQAEQWGEDAEAAQAAALKAQGFAEAARLAAMLRAPQAGPSLAG